MTRNIYQIVKSLPRTYWLMNLIQSIERLAFWSALIQLPIYIAQKDVDGTLQWEQTTKGLIFFLWALVQNLTPIIAGGIADKFGRKRIIVIGLLMMITGYLLFATQTNLLTFLIGALILGFGAGMFKPALQGIIASSVNENNSSVGWGIYTMLINATILFLGPIFISITKAISWQMLFIGCSILIAINFVPLIFTNIPKTDLRINANESNSNVLKDVFLLMREGKIILFVIIMSGFTIIYMQFYETLPNFIHDWVDSSSLVSTMKLPEFMTYSADGKRYISIEWLYALCSGLIVAFVVFLTHIFSPYNKIKIIVYGIGLTIIGIFLSGISQSGTILIVGMVIYTFGEMITNPKFNDYIASIAPQSRKSSFMGIMNLAWAIGLSGGSLLGGWLYQVMAEKSSLAKRYLFDHLMLEVNINHSEALTLLCEKTGLNRTEAMDLLWNTYSPYNFWLIFVFIGLISLIAMLIFMKKYSQKTVA